MQIFFIQYALTKSTAIMAVSEEMGVISASFASKKMDPHLLQLSNMINALLETNAMKNPLG